MIQLGVILSFWSRSGPERPGPITFSSRLSWLDEKRQYALQAFDPTNPAANPSLADPGANCLAIEGLALFPFMADRDASQPGFDRGEAGRFFFWRIWEPMLPLDLVRTVLALPRGEHGYSDSELRALGLRETFQSIKD